MLPWISKEKYNELYLFLYTAGTGLALESP